MPTEPTNVIEVEGRPIHFFYDLTEEDTNKYNVSNTCFHCGGRNTITLRGTQYFDYFQRGTKIQAAFPQLDAGDRELIKTGIHPACWDEMWAEPEEDEG